MQSLRQRQISEIVNQDLNINKRVVEALNKQVATFNETVTPPTTDQALNTDKLLNLIDNFNQSAMDSIAEIQSTHDIGWYTTHGINYEKFNAIMRLRMFVIKNNYNSKNLINQQMQTMIPVVNSFIIGLNNRIEESISEDIKESDLARFYSVLAIAETARASLVNGSYRPIELTDVDTTFNKIVQNLPLNVKNIVLLGLTKSPLSGFNRGNGEGFEDAKRRLEIELGRPLTKNDDLMLAIRMGNFTQFKPILTNTQISMLDPNANMDFQNIRPNSRNPSNFVGPYTELPDAPVVVPRAQTALENAENYDAPPRNPVNFVGPNTDLDYRDDRNEDPYVEGRGKGGRLSLRFI